jgi:ribosome-interacting GTPase 1
MGILEKISEIEKEIARTQKNKGKMNFRLELSEVLILCSTLCVNKRLYFSN